VDVAKFLCELLVVADIEIVITFLPKVRGLANQSARHSLLQRLDCIRESCLLRFADEKMDVLRHYDISVDVEFKVAAHSFKCGFEDACGIGGGERFSAMVAAEGYKVRLPGFVESL